MCAIADRGRQSGRPAFTQSGANRNSRAEADTQRNTHTRYIHAVRADQERGRPRDKTGGHERTSNIARDQQPRGSLRDELVKHVGEWRDHLGCSELLLRAANCLANRHPEQGGEDNTRDARPQKRCSPAIHGGDHAADDEAAEDSQRPAEKEHAVAVARFFALEVVSDH